MGRKAKRDSVRDSKLESYLDCGYDFDSAWSQAIKEADAAKLEQEQHRKKKNAEYQRAFRFRKKWSEDHKVENKTDYADITFNLHRESIAALDLEAMDLMNSDMWQGTFEAARQFVMVCLISKLSDKQEEKLIAYEKNISASKVFIELQRGKGFSDDDIQKDIDSLNIGKSIDEILNYKYKTGNN